MRQPHQRPLSTLLRLRRHEEDRAKQALVSAESDLALIQHRLAMLQESMAECNAAARQSLLEQGAWRNMGAYRKRIGEMQKELSRGRPELMAAEEVVARHRLELAVAIRRRRALERLAERVATVEAAGRGRKTQKDLDEMHAARQGHELEIQTAGLPLGGQQMHSP